MSGRGDSLQGKMAVALFAWLSVLVFEEDCEGRVGE